MLSDENRQWVKADEAVIERPRDIDSHPLLSEIYRHHDELITDHVTGRTLEVAFGRHLHPLADIGIDAFGENVKLTDRTAVVADVRNLPFDDATFQTVIGRRFLHHVPVENRLDMIQEMTRILESSGSLILLEGTPGLYRRAMKGMAFRLGILGDDNDEYGHLSQRNLKNLLDESGLQIRELRDLGSPFIPLSWFTGQWTTRFYGLYSRSQFIRWWTLAVATADK